MKNNNLDEVINKAKQGGSYFITASLLDKQKEENNITHHVFQEKFPISDIIPSIDDAIGSMGIKLERPVDVIKPPKIHEEKKPLKIAIISHFNSMPQSYSPARAVRNQIKILKEHGHEVVFFLQEGSPLEEEDLGCKLLKVIPKFHREKMIVNEEAKKKIIDIFREYLTSDFDIAITHDFFLKNTVTFSEAVRECNVPIEWLNFARSGVGHEMDFSMPNARFVYLNYTDVGSFARTIKVPTEQCRVVPNEKDPNFMFQWNPITKMIVNRFQLWDRDILMTYPVCSTRFAAKGLRDVIKVFVELKRLGNKVALVVPNSNGRRRADDIRREQEIAKEMGLNEDELIFTSLLTDEENNTASEVPNIVCAELMQISNLMIMATRAEVSSNILLEASMSNQLLVLNSDLPCLYDAVDKEAVLSYPFTSDKNLHYKGRDNESLNKLAKQIVGQIKSNKADLQFRHVWRNYNSYSVYHNILKPILYEQKKQASQEAQEGGAEEGGEGEVK